MKYGQVVFGLTCGIVMAGHAGYTQSMTRFLEAQYINSTILADDSNSVEGTPWKQITMSGPSARYQASMVFDSKINKMLLFGGRNENYALNDSWLWTSSLDTVKWMESGASGISISRYGSAINMNDTIEI